VHEGFWYTAPASHVLQLEHSSQFQKPPPQTHEALRRTHPPGQASQVSGVAQIMFPFEHGIPGSRVLEQDGASNANGLPSSVPRASTTVVSASASLPGAGTAPFEHPNSVIPMKPPHAGCAMGEV
jgi:hypothetical protein